MSDAVTRRWKVGSRGGRRAAPGFACPGARLPRASPAARVLSPEEASASARGLGFGRESAPVAPPSLSFWSSSSLEQDPHAPRPALSGGWAEPGSPQPAGDLGGGWGAAPGPPPSSSSAFPPPPVPGAAGEGLRGSPVPCASLSPPARSPDPVPGLLVPCGAPRSPRGGFGGLGARSATLWGRQRLCTPGGPAVRNGVHRSTVGAEAVGEE